MILARVPIESARAVVLFAATRLGVAATGCAAILLLDFPGDDRAAAVVGALAVPWSAALLLFARRRPEASMSPLVAVGDLTILIAIELVAPVTYGGVRFAALFLIAGHAHFQGERRALALAVGWAVALVGCAALGGDSPLDSDVLAFYETIFAICAISTGVVVGRLRTVESASRLQAHQVSRRTIQAEALARRRVADSLHDGPVQELIGLDMMLSAAGRELDGGDPGRAGKLIADAREVAGRNVRVLRDEIVALGPYAFEELSLAAAIENSLPVWRRRFGFELMASIEPFELPPETAEDLFRIAQEAVANAGRHAGAGAVSLALRAVDGGVELRIVDDGHGFNGVDPAAYPRPGHLGLASMRERAELLGGTLRIESSERGTRVVALVPFTRPRAR